MRGLNEIRASNPALADKLLGDHGFITSKEDLAAIAASNRMLMVLIRCGNGRFLAPAQDAQHFHDIITRENTDYVRDISLPA